MRSNFLPHKLQLLNSFRAEIEFEAYWDVLRLFLLMINIDEAEENEKSNLPVGSDGAALSFEAKRFSLSAASNHNLIMQQNNKQGHWLPCASEETCWQTSKRAFALIALWCCKNGRQTAGSFVCANKMLCRWKTLSRRRQNSGKNALYNSWRSARLEVNKSEQLKHDEDSTTPRVYGGLRTFFAQFDAARVWIQWKFIKKIENASNGNSLKETNFCLSFQLLTFRIREGEERNFMLHNLKNLLQAFENVVAQL